METQVPTDQFSNSVFIFAFIILIQVLSVFQLFDIYSFAYETFEKDASSSYFLPSNIISSQTVQLRRYLLLCLKILFQIFFLLPSHNFTYDAELIYASFLYRKKQFFKSSDCLFILKKLRTPRNLIRTRIFAGTSGN